MKIKRLTLDALLLSLALIVYVIENAVPLIPGLPFFRVGFSNIVIMFTVFWVGRSDGLILLLSRNLIGAIFSPNPSMIIYSMSGGLLAFGLMVLLYAITPHCISLIGVSIASAIAHTVGQMAVFSLISGSIGVLSILPYLTILASLGGAVTGTITHLLLKYLPIEGK